jgi:hypothetical protein
VRFGRCRDVNRGPRAERIQAAVEASGVTGHALQKFVRNVGITAGSGTTFRVTMPKQRPRGPLMDPAICIWEAWAPQVQASGSAHSFESKEAKSTIIWRDGAVRIAGRVIPAIFDPANVWQSEARSLNQHPSCSTIAGLRNRAAPHGVS